MHGIIVQLAEKTAEDGTSCMVMKKTNSGYYIEFYNRKKDTPRVIPVTSRFYISLQFSSAWQKNPVSKRDGRTWDEIPEARKKNPYAKISKF